MTELHDDFGKRPNKVVFTITRAETSRFYKPEIGPVETWSSPNLRSDIGVNWQVNHMFNASIEPAANIAISSRATAPVSGDTDLKGELSGNGLSRQTGTFSHTADQSLATLSAVWQNTGSTVTVKKAAVATAATDLGTSADTHFLLTDVSPDAVLASNDTIAIDWGINV